MYCSADDRREDTEQQHEHYSADGARDDKEQQHVHNSAGDEIKGQ